MSKADITVYGAHWCPDCRRSKQFLGEHQIPYNWVDIEEDSKAEQFVIQKNDGKRIIPTILIDSDPDRCRKLAAASDRLVVVHGDPTDPKVMQGEGIDSVDMVVALTGWDEINIVGCLVAKALGVPTTVAPRRHSV